MFGWIKQFSRELKPLSGDFLDLHLGQLARSIGLFRRSMIHALAAGGLKMTTIYFLVAALLGRSGLLRPLALADALPQTDHGLHSQITAILQQGPSQATAGMIFSIMRCLWKARNDHRFNKNQLDGYQGFACHTQNFLFWIVHEKY
jgi:hypothetical protein